MPSQNSMDRDQFGRDGVRSYLALDFQNQVGNHGNEDSDPSMAMVEDHLCNQFSWWFKQNSYNSYNKSR